MTRKQQKENQSGSAGEVKQRKGKIGEETRQFITPNLNFEMKSRDGGMMRRKGKRSFPSGFLLL